MKLNKTLALAAILSGSLFAGSPLQAQDAATPPPADKPAAGGPVQRGRPTIDQIAKQLELTDAQKPKVQAVLEEQTKKMQELRQDTSLSQEDRRTKMKEIRDAGTAKLKEILTPEQLAKWEKMGPGQRQRPGAGGPPPAAGDANAPK